MTSRDRGPAVGTRGLVMVIDGDAGAREALSAYLGRIGYEPRVAEDDAQALALLRGDDWPAAVVRDAAGAPAGGSTFAERMRSRPDAAPALLTMTKPFQLVDFGDKLLRLLREQRARAEAS